MESEASPRRHANAVEWDDAQHQRAGGIADAVVITRSPRS